ncbi:hypothetical protein ACKVAY_024940 [Pseudomonas aeruginosa]
MRFAFLTGLSDRPDLLYAWIERRPADANLRYATPGGYAEAAKRIEEAKAGVKSFAQITQGLKPYMGQ